MHKRTFECIHIYTYECVYISNCIYIYIYIYTKRERERERGERESYVFIAPVSSHFIGHRFSLAKANDNI